VASADAQEEKDEESNSRVVEVYPRRDLLEQELRMAKAMQGTR
jgi:hypothetical protein